MPYTVRDLGSLTPTSSGATATIGVGHLDDASSITVFFTSSANANSSVGTIQVSMFDPADAFPAGLGIVQSSAWFNYNLISTVAGATQAISTAGAVTINNVSFRGLRLSVTTSTAGEIIAWVTKQISV